MRHLVLTIAAFFAFAAVPVVASADQVLQTITFKNTTGSPAWITIYTEKSTPDNKCQTLISGLSNSCGALFIASGAYAPRCVAGFSTYTYPQNTDNIYYVKFRAQVIKGHGDCHPETFHDLYQIISVSPQASPAITAGPNPKVELDLQGSNTFLLKISQ